MTFTLKCSRHHAPYDEEHEDIHSAIYAAWAMVEWNEAAPGQLVEDDGTVIAEGFDIANMKDDPEYKASLPEADVIALFKRRKDENERAARAAERRKAEERNEKGRRLSELLTRLPSPPTIEYTHAYGAEDLKEDVLGPVPPAEWDFDAMVARPVRSKVVAGHTRRDVHRVRPGGMFDPGTSGRVAGHEHFLVETERGDFVRLDDAKVVD